MRNEESNEASFAEREDIVGGADAASEKAAIMAVPKEHEGAATGTASRKPARSTLAIFSYILSASAVVAAFGFLLAVGLSGRYSSVAQDSSVAQIPSVAQDPSVAQGQAAQPATAAAGQKQGAAAPVQMASVEPAATEAPAPAQAVPVLTGMSEKRAAPLTAEAVGRAESIASITVRTRVDGQIAKVLFHDGQAVAQGDVLYELDARQVEAQIRQAEAVVAKDRSQIVQTKRDLVRTTRSPGRTRARSSICRTPRPRRRLPRRPCSATRPRSTICAYSAATTRSFRR